MKELIAVSLSGFLFAIGLGISGMTDADKVIGFLNVAGQWDPSLAFVMVGAISINLVLFRLILKRDRPLFAPSFELPNFTDINKKLVGGAAIFGVGWGLGGFCPGPGIVSITSFGTEAIIFTVAMLSGMFVFQKTS